MRSHLNGFGNHCWNKTKYDESTFCAYAHRKCDSFVSSFFTCVSDPRENGERKHKMRHICQTNVSEKINMDSHAAHEAFAKDKTDFDIDVFDGKWDWQAMHYEANIPPAFQLIEIMIIFFSSKKWRKSFSFPCICRFNFRVVLDDWRNLASAWQRGTQRQKIAKKKRFSIYIKHTDEGTSMRMNSIFLSLQIII